MRSSPNPLLWARSISWQISNEAFLSSHSTVVSSFAWKLSTLCWSISILLRSKRWYCNVENRPCGKNMAGQSTRSCTLGAEIEKYCHLFKCYLIDIALNSYLDKLLNWISVNLSNDILNSWDKMQFSIGTNFWNTLYLGLQLFTQEIIRISRVTVSYP